MNAREGGNAKWWLLAIGLIVSVPAFCCCGMFMLGALTPAPAAPPSSESPVPVPVDDLPEPPPAQTVETPAVAEVDPPVEPAAPTVPEEGASAEPGLPGIGATRAHWEATHRRASGFADGVVFGPMVQSADGSGFNPTYATVFGDDRIITYALNLLRGMTFDAARARMLRELPPDAREVRTRRLRECRMIRYRSATMRRLFGSERHRGDVEVGFFSTNPDVFDPRRVTFTTVSFYVGEDIDC